MKKNNFNFSELSTWTATISSVFAIVISAVVFYVINSFFVSSKTTQIKQTSAQVIKISNEYRKNQDSLADLPGLIKELSELTTLRDRLTSLLPTKVSMPRLIDNVDKAAEKNGIFFNSFVPQSDISTPYYTIKPIAISSKIGYISMSKFIQEVAALERIMNVESVSFNREGDFTETENSPLSVSAEIRTYIFKDN